MAKETQAMVVQDDLQGQVGSLALQRDPEEVLEEAVRAAKALKSILDSKKKKVMMGDERYLEFDDWQVCGRFYGYTVAEDGEPEFVDLGAAQGFKASAVVLNRDGREVSRATAYCMNDEEKWSSRPKYIWAYVCKDGTLSEEDPGVENITWIDNPNKKGKRMPKKEKTRMGEEKVPIFQLSSMAQTRACAKAFRNVLSWIVVLAGYKATPAEELPNAQVIDEGEDFGDDPQGTHAPKQSASRLQGDREIQMVSDAEREEIFSEGTNAGFTSKFATLKFLKEKFDINDVAQVTSAQYPKVLDAIRGYKQGNGNGNGQTQPQQTQPKAESAKASTAKPSASTNDRPAATSKANPKDVKIDDNKKGMVWTFARKQGWAVGTGDAGDALHLVLKDKFKIEGVMDIRESMLAPLMDILMKSPKDFGYKVAERAAAR